MIVIGKGKNSVEQMASAWFGGKLHQRSLILLHTPVTLSF